MDTEKTQYGNGQDDSPPEEKKPIIDQVTDLAADAAGTLAETAVKAGAKKAREAIAKRLPRPVKKAANTIAKAAKAPKKSAKKTTKKSKKPAKRTKSSARRKTVGKRRPRELRRKRRRGGGKDGECYHARRRQQMIEQTAIGCLLCWHFGATIEAAEQRAGSAQGRRFGRLRGVEYSHERLWRAGAAIAIARRRAQRRLSLSESEVRWLQKK